MKSMLNENLNKFKSASTSRSGLSLNQTQSATNDSGQKSSLINNLKHINNNNNNNVQKTSTGNFSD